MTPTLSASKKKFFWFLATLAITAVVFGITSTLLPSSFALTKEVLSKIAEAFLIAAILAAGVDGYVKERLVEECARDISQFAVGTLLPEELRTEIRRLLRLPVLRKEYQISYRILPVLEKPGYVKCTVGLQWNVENVTDSPQPYTHRVTLEKSYFPEVGSSRILSAGCEAESGGYSFRHGDGKLKIEESGGLYRFAHEQMLPQGPHSTRVYWSEYESVFPETYSDTSYVLMPTVGVTLTLQYPEDFVVGVQSPTRTDLLALPPDRPTHFHYSGVFLPGQYVEVRWRREGSEVGQPDLAAQPAATSK
jgi:hypothetical protein